MFAAEAAPADSGNRSGGRRQAKGFGVAAPLFGLFRDGRISGCYRQRIGFNGSRDEFKRSGTFARCRRNGGIDWLAGRFRRGELKADPPGHPLNADGGMPAFLRNQRKGGVYG